MPYDVDSPPEVASKYSPMCRRAFVHAFNSVYADSKDDGRAMAAGHAAARRCEGKRSSMHDVKFNIVTGLLKALPSEDGVKRLKTTASSTITDLADDNLELSALEEFASAARENMTIFLNHKYQVPEDVLGSVEHAEILHKGGDLYDLDFLIRVDESNDRAVKTWSQINNGTKLGTSIGARIPGDGYERKESGGLRIKHILPMEASIVGIPANPRSFAQYALKALHDAEAEEEEEAVSMSSGLQPAVNINLGAVPVTESSADSQTVAVRFGDDGTMEVGTPLPEGDSDEPATIADEGDDKADSDEPLTESDVTSDAPAEGESAEGDEPSQEASKSVPESDGIDDEDTRTVLSKGIETLEALLRASNSELVETRKQLAGETEIRVKAERERDEARRDLKLARDIVERISALPIGRRTSFKAATSEFRTRFAGIYDEETLKLLERESNVE